MNESNIKNIIAILSESDYARRITVMNYEEAIEFLDEVNEANGFDESIEDFFGESLEENSIVLYALPNNGDGRAFVYTPAHYQHFFITAREAYEHAYDERLDIPEEYCD